MTSIFSERVHQSRIRQLKGHTWIIFSNISVNLAVFRRLSVNYKMLTHLCAWKNCALAHTTRVSVWMWSERHE